MNIVRRFNNLDGKNVGRRSLERIAQRAKEDGYTAIFERINKILTAYPDTAIFDIELTEKVKEKHQTTKENLQGLGVPLTKELKKKIFRANGRLNKGFYYDSDGFLTDGKQFFVDYNSDFKKFEEKLSSFSKKMTKKKDELHKDKQEFSKRSKKVGGKKVTPKVDKKIKEQKDKENAHKKHKQEKFKFKVGDLVLYRLNNFSVWENGVKVVTKISRIRNKNSYYHNKPIYTIENRKGVKNVLHLHKENLKLAPKNYKTITERLKESKNSTLKVDKTTKPLEDVFAKYGALVSYDDKPKFCFIEKYNLNGVVVERKYYENKGKKAFFNDVYKLDSFILNKCLVLKNRYRLFNGTKLLKTIQQAIAC